MTGVRVELRVFVGSFGREGFSVSNLSLLRDYYYLGICIPPIIKYLLLDNHLLEAIRPLPRFCHPPPTSCK